MFQQRIHYQISQVSFSLLSIGLLISVVLSLMAKPAEAACSYEGQTYQTGDTVGPLICMPDGSMQPQ